MKKAFITYSHADTVFVDRLVSDLESIQGLSVAFDKRVLKPGDSLLKLFEEIGESGFLIPVLSPSSVASNWVKKELSVAIVREIEEPNTFKVIPAIHPDAKWNEIRGTLPAQLRESLRDKYLARFDSKPYPDVLRELFSSLAPTNDPQKLYLQIQGEKSDNPFRRIRTEYFEDVRILARSFTEPENILYDRLVEVKPTVIEGGRGSGKTMLLRSLEGVVSVYRSGQSSFREAQLSYFGVYCRFTRGAFATGTGGLQAEIASRLFMTELTLQLIQSLIEELQQCVQQRMLTISTAQEQSVSTEIAHHLRPGLPDSQPPRDFQSLAASGRRPSGQ